MKKVVYLFAAVVLFAGLSLNAQSKLSFNAGANAALPMGSFADVAGFGFGASVGAEMPVADKITGTASVGYLMFGEKELGGTGFSAKSSFSAIPILVGSKYAFNDNFYGAAEVGFHLFSGTVKSEITLFGSTTSAEATESTTDFTVGVGAGYMFGKLDVSAKYYLISDANYLGVRVAYHF
ncbi:MAG: outer membrane beta-barrel protein [Melioribacteraceae bacterium]|nr:outer membrane beta-barrel protein [Melioribacteraceae bacterium]